MHVCAVYLSLLQKVELDVMMTDVHGFSCPLWQVLCAKPLKSWTAIVSAFLELRMSSIPIGMVVAAASDTMTAGCISGPVMWRWPPPRILKMFLRVVDFPAKAKNSLEYQLTLV